MDTYKNLKVVENVVGQAGIALTNNFKYIADELEHIENNIVEVGDEVNTLSAQHGIFPSWEEGNNWEGLRTAFSYWAGKAHPVSGNRYEFIGPEFSSGGTKWAGGVLAPNGCIYGIPRGATSILKIDTNNDSVTTFGNVSGHGSRFGGVLAPNGFIYIIPWGSVSVLKINPEDDTYTTFGDLGSGNKWLGGVLANNGMIYGIPYESSKVLKIDPSDDTTSLIGDDLPDTEVTAKFHGGVLAPNGMIYGIPATSAYILKIDPSTDNVTTFGDVGEDPGKYFGGVLAPNGMIYGIPFQESVLKIDPSDDSYSIFGDSTGSNKWGGGTLMPDGRIVGSPSSATSIFNLNPPDEYIWILNGLDSTTFKYYGAVLAPNGCVYCIAHNATRVLKVGIPFDTQLDFCLSRYYNKL